ncbi:trypsin-like peptidase domain-containing protein [Sphingorhabdus arenilitoris]|uniref:Probable periplasmic serine endoprotease DegP-like n=1 Tax=Sphingorhabdus arenilitoris TaxID=1490041 RepID=A0ABV8RJ79_9SPHN
MRIAYSVTTALLLTGSVISLVTGNPVTAQTAVPVSQAGLAPAGAPNSFADLAAQLQPAVVNIATKQKVRVATSFNPFTGEQRPIEREQASGGSGFIISSDGYIVTNNHVIASGTGQNDEVDSVTVTLFGGKEYAAEIIGRDVTSDVAVIKIKAKDLPFVEMASSQESRVGDWVIAIGNPLGLGSTVTAGIISALQRNIGAGGAYDRFIQTDTAINPGNSGGPLFNLKGQVIGINNRLISPIGANIGVGFAIPAEEAEPVVEALRKGEKLQRGYLGIGIRPVDEDTADSLGIAKNRGELVGNIQPNQPAAKAGLMEGDIVLKVAGKEVTPEQTLSYIVANIKPGTKITLDILRKGKPKKIDVVVGERPTEQEIAQSNFNPDEEKDFQGDTESSDAKVIRDSFGISVLPMDERIARQLGMPADQKGLVVDIVGRAGTAAAKGLRRGNVIVSANYKDIGTTADLVAAIKEAKTAGRRTLLLGVKPQRGATQYVAVAIAE